MDNFFQSLKGYWQSRSSLFPDEYEYIYISETGGIFSSVILELSPMRLGWTNICLHPKEESECMYLASIVGSEEQWELKLAIEYNMLVMTRGDNELRAQLISEKEVPDWFLKKLELRDLVSG